MTTALTTALVISVALNVLLAGPALVTIWEIWLMRDW
jgi:hypothetical protein